ncbi:hypothetical protein ILUMI_00598 [Ignelater luminosus]|uniref:DDE Tnp4 domain-containing protein n=1 Tax=Ignelater luminosus TaxID=2038154 RepID=A0A8K0GL27_IGNLU|nr:hypothetical protein ILUMI_00598 [Ignelater luminosus]
MSWVARRTRRNDSDPFRLKDGEFVRLFRLTNDLNWMKFPITPDKKTAINQQFMANFRFLGCIGCIDCTHVSIIAPKDEEHNYLNRKSFHSKNVQLICDWNLKVPAVNARYAGATHDAAIWNTSDIRDSGYPQLPWLMAPILHPTPGAKELHNQRLSSTRNCIERCNSVLRIVNNEEQHNQEAKPLVQDGRQARRNLFQRYFQ